MLAVLAGADWSKALRAANPRSSEYESAVAARWGTGDPTIRSFWQSQVVLAEINRRITGDPELTPAEYFASRYCPTVRRRALSIGCGDAQLELSMLQLGACERILAVDLSEERLRRARARTTPELSDRIEYVCANVETWRPEGRFDLVVTKGALHHLENLEGFFELVELTLEPDGLVYLDEFVGPSRFQWTDKQLEIINRVLDRLSPELRKDLVEGEGGRRPPVTRPSIAGLIATDPSESARSHEIPELLHARLETVEERAYGGAIFHQLFNRIMGNFAGNDDLVRVLMELDAILTDEGVVESDYLWGVYRRRSAEKHWGHSEAVAVRVEPGRAEVELDGRIEEIEEGQVFGWAARRDRPEEHLAVDLYVDHKLVAKGVADRPRADLVREGLGDGAHGFALEIPSWVRDGRGHSLSVLVAGKDSLLAARGWADRNRGEPGQSPFAWARHDPTLPAPPPTRVLIGRDGWAFPCDDAVGSIEQMLGRLRLTSPDQAAWRQAFELRHSQLASLDIPFLVAIVPAKASLYRERLPDATPALDAPVLGRELEQALEAPIQSVDLLTPMQQVAAGGEELYFARDTDCNYRGALIATLTLLDAVRDLGLEIDSVNPESVHWHEQRARGNLAGRPGVQLQDGRFVEAGASAGAEAVACPNEGRLGIARRPAPETLAGLAKELELIERPEAGSSSTALVTHQSCGRRMQPFVGAAFSRSLWVGSTELDLRLVEAASPDVVIEILDEPELVRAPYETASGSPARSR